MAVLPSFYILERRGKKKMNYLGEGFNIISKGLIAFGGVWTVWGRWFERSQWSRH